MLNFLALSYRKTLSSSRVWDSHQVTVVSTDFVLFRFVCSGAARSWRICLFVSYFNTVEVCFGKFSFVSVFFPRQGLVLILREFKDSIISCGSLISKSNRLYITATLEHKNDKLQPQ